MDQERRRVEVEDQLLQKKLGGTPIEGEGDMPGDVFMADNITFPTKTPKQQPQPDTFKNLLGGAALAAAIGLPLAWLGSRYIDSQRPELPSYVDTDTDTTRGLEILK